MLFFEKLALVELKWPLVPILVLGTGTGYWAVLGTGSTGTGGVGGTAVVLVSITSQVLE